MFIDTERKGLRRGFSTGSISTAAIKASIRYYFEPKKFPAIEIKMPGGEKALLNVHSLEKYRTCRIGADVSKAIVVKDAGDDDSDVTNGIKICADFTFINKNNKNELPELKKYYEKFSVYNIIKRLPSSISITIMFASSEGIGIATRAGLPVKAGFPAVNPVPRSMIESAATEELDLIIKKSGIENSFFSDKIFISVLYVPEGEKTAQKTLNPRLGIKGGISILGTTGYVVPISAKAWLETIKTSLRFLSENKIYKCVYTPGRYSEKIALKIIKDVPRESFIEIGDYVTYSVRKAAKYGIKHIILAGQFGKIIKIAQGARNTNAKYGGLNLIFLAETARRTIENICACSGSGLFSLIANSNTSREAYNHIISGEFKAYSDIIFENIIKIAAQNMAKAAGEGVRVEIILISYDGVEIKRTRV
jgi:cobalt-precorrin-5B (C1)-methyltransferase